MPLYPPHIVLSDIVMPVLDGVDFSRIVQRKYPGIQIIILSSYDNFEYVKSTLLSGDMVHYDALLERYLLGFDAKIDEGTFESCFPNILFL